MIIQQQQQQQQQTTPLISVPQPTNFLPVTTPAPSIVQQTSVEQPQIVRQSSENPSVKPVVATEPTPINQLQELSPNIPGSAGSLEVLEAALKKTFNKNNIPQGTNTTSTIANDTSEPQTSLLNQDDSLISKPGTDTTVVEQQQQQQPIEEPGLPITSESSTSKLFR
jgi:hypothetical protein